MKIMPTPDRAEVEANILRWLCHRPDFFENFPLSVKDFQNPINKKFFSLFSELKAQGKQIDLVSFSTDFEFSEIRHLFAGEDYPSPRDFLQCCEKLREDTLRISILKKAEDCEDTVDFFRFMELAKQVNTIKTLETFNEHLDKYIQENEEIIERNKNGESIGLLNYWDKFSQKVPMLRGDYCVIGANTSIGKTSFSLNLAVNAAALGQKVLFISLEMPRKHIFDKIAAILSQSPVHEYKFALNPLKETKVILEMLKDHFNFVYAPNCTTANVSQIIKKIGKIDLVVIDYIQLLRDPVLKNDNENLRISRISGALKMMAGENNCVVVVPSQLSRDNVKQAREPRLSDLRDSGSLEQDASIVILLHRDESENAAKVKAIVAKNRTGECCEIDFAFKTNCSFFEELKPKPSTPIQINF